MNKTAENHTDFFNLVSKYRAAIMGFAAIWIFIFHNRFFFPLFINPKYIFICIFIKNIGFCGVDIFLFLSGIGLYSSLSRNSLKQYYMNRIKRIGFVYLSASAIYAIVCNWSILKFIKVITLWQSFSVDLYYSLWFYTLIIPVYILFPAYFYLFKKSSNRLLFTILMLIFWINLGLALKPIMRTDLWGFYDRIPIIIIGIYLGYWSSSHSLKITPVSICLLIASLSLGVYLKLITTITDIELPIPYNHFPITIMAISLCFILAWIFSLVANNSILKYIIRFLCIWGTISLEFYSLQEILMHLTYEFITDNIPAHLRSILTFVIVSLTAYSLHIINKLVFALPNKYNSYRAKANDTTA